MTWDKWSVVKFCNDCWTFLASMLYVAMQRLDFSWIPMYFYVKKLIPEIFYLFIRYEHRYAVTLLYHFLLWIFLIFLYFLKMFLYYISQGRTQCRELPLCARSGEGCQWQAIPSPVQCEETATRTQDLPVTGGKTLPLAPGPPFIFAALYIQINSPVI